MKHAPTFVLYAFVAALILALYSLAGCSTPDDPTAAAALKIANAATPDGFWDRARAFAQEVLVPAFIGFLLILATGGGLTPAVVGGTSTAVVSNALRPEDQPRSVTVVQVPPGTPVTVESASSPDASKLPAVSEGLMNAIEHYGFWLLFAGYLVRNHKHLIDILTGGAKGRVFRTLVHTIFGRPSLDGAA